jgi:hypothetical protein
VGLAANLVALAGEPSRWAAMGRAGRDWIEGHHDVRRLAGQLEQLYRDVAAEPAGEVRGTA